MTTIEKRMARIKRLHGCEAKAITDGERARPSQHEEWARIAKDIA
jgi:hypothetical protein